MGVLQVVHGEADLGGGQHLSIMQLLVHIVHRDDVDEGYEDEECGHESEGCDNLPTYADADARDEAGQGPGHEAEAAVEGP